MKKIGVYIHIPFCKQKCYYCDFISFAKKEEIQERYIKALKKEIEDQISTYLPYFSLVEVEIKNIDNKTVTFNIVLDDTLVRFKSSSSDYSLEEISSIL